MEVSEIALGCTRPNSPVAPLQQMPRAEPAATPPDNYPPFGWAGLPPLRSENTFAASNGGRDVAGGQPLAPQSLAPPPAPMVENLTTRTLRMKGVPEADIAAAINDPGKMQDLLNQRYGRRSMTAPGAGSSLGNVSTGAMAPPLAAAADSAANSARSHDFVPRVFRVAKSYCRREREIENPLLITKCHRFAMTSTSAFRYMSRWRPTMRWGTCTLSARRCQSVAGMKRYTGSG